MSSVPFNTTISNYPFVILAHLHKRMKERRFTLAMNSAVVSWGGMHPMVPDYDEAPLGWYKKFPKLGLTILGKGEFWRTIYTPVTSTYRIKDGVVNWDEWIKKQGKEASRKSASIDALFGSMGDDDFADVNVYPGDLGSSRTKEEDFREFDQDDFSDVDEHPGSLDL